MTRFGPFRVKRPFGIRRVLENAVAGALPPFEETIFGGVAATVVVVASATSLTAVTPHHPAGAADVAVVNPGSQIGTRSDASSTSSSCYKVA